MIIGLTGSIASAKSTVAKMMIELGLQIVDADVVARDVV
ncbi:dephospho-CoA kinase, partial [Bacillus cereus]